MISHHSRCHDFRGWEAGGWRPEAGRLEAGRPEAGGGGRRLEARGWQVRGWRLEARGILEVIGERFVDRRLQRFAIIGYKLSTLLCFFDSGIDLVCISTRPQPRTTCGQGVSFSPIPIICMSEPNHV